MSEQSTASSTDTQNEKAENNTMQPPPTIQDDSGRADEWFARFIIIAPWLLGAVTIVTTYGLAAMGMVTFDVVITGSLSIQYLLNVLVKPLVWVGGGLITLVYLLAIAKEWGLAPIAWIGKAAKNYNP